MSCISYLTGIALAISLLSIASAQEVLQRFGHVIVEPNITYQTLTGYGQGSMDQANPKWYENLNEAERKHLLDRLYTLEGDGLGMNICRTYLCAGDAPGHAHMDRRNGGSLSPLGYEPEDGKFQWEGHENTLWHAQGAAQRGAMMVAFFNSPPWWMTISGCTSGSASGHNNLKSGLEARFAKHICDVLKQYRDTWGVDFDRISPINEPESDWWREGGGQDGCGVDAAQAILIINTLEKQLRQEGLKAKVQAFEAAFAGSLGYLDDLLADAETYNALAELTCHQYIADAGNMRKWPVRAKLHKKGLWQSEWGDWTNKDAVLAMNYATKIHEAHRAMQAEAWCMWEPGFLFEGEKQNQPNAAFYAVGQYSRFARPGMQVIECTDTLCKTTAYLDREAGRLVLITTNDSDAPAQLQFDLSSFEGIEFVDASYSTLSEHYSPQLCEVNPAFMRMQAFAKSVTSCVLSFTGIKPSLLENGGFETGEFAPWKATGTATMGVQNIYPQGGLHDAFIDMNAGQSGQLILPELKLKPGARYALSATAATSGIIASFKVQGQNLLTEATAKGGSYQLLRLEFVVPEDGIVNVSYSCDTAKEWCWATFDNVRLSYISDN